MQIKVKKEVHIVYKEWIEARKQGFATRQLMGKWHYIYSSPKGKISLIRLMPFLEYDGKTKWEIYSLEGEVFDDVERYNTKKEAESAIEKYLL